MKIKRFNDFINENVNMEGDDLMDHILTNYVPIQEEENDIDDFSDEFEYYDNIISWAVNDYIEKERPSEIDNDDLIDELMDELKDYWSPI
ncbi:MAG: hypothetical protein WDA02_07345 [Saccharofermentanales bacterium]